MPWKTGKGASVQRRSLPFSEDYVRRNANLKSSLEIEIPDQVIIDVQNVLDLADNWIWINHKDRLAFIQKL